MDKIREAEFKELLNDPDIFYDIWDYIPEELTEEIYTKLTPDQKRRVVLEALVNKFAGNAKDEVDWRPNDVPSSEDKVFLYDHPFLGAVK